MNKNTNQPTTPSGFTHGFAGTPHGYDPSAPVKACAVKKSKHVKGGFGADGGTIAHLAPPHLSRARSGMTIKRQK